MKRCLYPFLHSTSNADSATWQSARPDGWSMMRSLRQLAGQAVEQARIMRAEGMLIPESELPKHAVLDSIRAARPPQSIGKIIRRRSVRCGYIVAPKLICCSKRSKEIRFVPRALRTLLLINGMRPMGALRHPATIAARFVHIHLVCALC